MHHPQERGHRNIADLCYKKRHFKMIKKIVKFFREHKKTSWFSLIITILIMTYCSSIKGNSVSFSSSYPSIIYHFTIFLGFSFFLFAVIRNKNTKTVEILITILISIIVSVLDELHQSFVPLRDPSIKDALIDFSGSIIAIISSKILEKD